MFMGQIVFNEVILVNITEKRSLLVVYVRQYVDPVDISSISAPLNLNQPFYALSYT